MENGQPPTVADSCPYHLHQGPQLWQGSCSWLTCKQAKAVLWLVQIVYLALPPGTIGQPKCQHRCNVHLDLSGPPVLHSGYCCCYFSELASQFPASCLILWHSTSQPAWDNTPRWNNSSALLLPCRNDSQHQKTSTIIKTIWRNSKSNMTSTHH